MITHVVTRFSSRQDAEAHRAHPFHRGVAGRLATMASTRSLVDFGG